MYRGILVIDNCKATQELFQLLLGKNFEVRILAKTKDIATIHFEEISMVFLNLHLPGEGGIRVVENIKGSYPSIPIVALSSFTDEETCMRAFRAGARDYIINGLKIV